MVVLLAFVAASRSPERPPRQSPMGIESKGLKKTDAGTPSLKDQVDEAKAQPKAE